MLSLLFAASLAVAQAPDSAAHVVLVATTDVHGRATAWDYLADREAPGGITRVATVVDSIRRRHPGQVVVLDAGDLLQGNPFAAYAARQGRRGPNPVVEAMNLAGYDVATPGNHDFDWGVAELERALTDAAFPYVSANLHTLPGDTLLVSPFRVLRRGPVRIAVTGFTTPGAMVWDREQLRGRVRVGRIEAAARRTFEAMRGASDLSWPSHTAASAASRPTTPPASAPRTSAGAFASLPVKPDIVVVGHSHAEIRDTLDRRACTSCSRGPMPRASPWSTWTWCGAGAGDGRRCGSAPSCCPPARRPRRRSSRSGSARSTIRCARG